MSTNKATPVQALAAPQRLALQQALLGAGFSALGARQLAAGEVVTNAADRQLLAHELTHVLQQRTTTRSASALPRR